ncbi:MAG: uroporphyrinogen decarboxylase [Gammaproteobacteria bacterium]
MSVWEDTLFFRALRCRPAARRPVWLMRQAGRYLPEYRKLRAESGGFLPMLKTPELACEITLQPVRRFGLDAAIIFSDILTIPDAMGLRLHFVENEGPRFAAPADSEETILKLQEPPPESLQYVAAACGLARGALPPDVPLIGFCGAPWTLACYMIDGGGGGFWRTRAMRHSRPDLLHRVLEINAAACISLLRAQLAAGAQAAMIFDSWGGLLGGGDYEDFSLEYIRRIVAAIAPAPTIVFARDCGFHLPKIAACGCDAVGADWRTPLAAARRMSAGRTAIQGNLDPAALLSDAESAAAATRRVLEDFGGAPGHIFNLGHGVHKDTPPENVAALVETVRHWKPDSAE